MAYNEIQVGRFLRYFQKVFSMKGREPSEITLAGEILPSLQIQAGGVEDRSLQAWETFEVADSQAAVAAQSSVFGIRNPAGSNVIAVIERIRSFDPGIQQFVLLKDQDTADFATVVGANGLDDRGRILATLIFSHSTTARAITVNKAQWHIGIANTALEFIWFEEQEIPLLPGHMLTVQGLTVNQQDFCSVRWRERFLEESERK